MPPADRSSPVLRPRDLPAAVLWDMDGTLVDTEPCWMAAEGALVAEFGGRWTQEDALSMIGLPLLEGAAVLQRHGVDLPREVIVERMLSSVEAAVRAEVTWQEGARELLAALRDVGVPCALVTMSYRSLAEAVAAGLPDGTFDVLVTGDDVEKGKPDPESYLRAAELLGVDPTDCVAIEDSPPGITAALASGARTLGVQHIAPVEARPGLSRSTTLAGIGLPELARMVRGEVLDLLTTPTGPS